MAQTVKLKRTSVADRHATTSHIEVGELAFNSNDKSLFIRGDSNAIVTLHDEDTLHIDHINNRVGIGTSSPTDPLVVQSSGASMGGGATLTNSYFTITDGTTSMFHDPNELFSNINGSFHIGATHSNGLLRFQTGGTSTRMVILANGNVGIGTDNPGATLHVKGDGREFYLSSADHNVARIIPRGTGSNLDKGLFSLFDASTEDIRLDTGGDSWIDSGSNLGIGTKSPSSLLTVEGDIRQTTGDLLYQGGGNWDIKHLAASQNILFYTKIYGTHFNSYTVFFIEHRTRSCLQLLETSKSI